MDIEALASFLAVVDYGSFSEAGERQFLTQPAISKRIAGLESELDTRLFDRIGRTVKLTEAGRTLLPRARSVIVGLADAKRELSNLTGQVQGVLRMGTSHHIGLHRLPSALANYYKQHPNVEIDLRFVDSENGCELVRQGQLELAVVTLPTRLPEQLRAQLVWEDPLEIVMAPQHPLASKRKLTLSMLLEHPAILPGPGTFTRELIFTAFGRSKSRIKVAMASNYLEVIKMLVAVGLGWSALPHTLIDESLVLSHAEGIHIQRRLGIVTHESLTLSNAAQAMIETIKGC